MIGQRIAIHAGKKKFDLLELDAGVRRAYLDIRGSGPPFHSPEIPFGAVVATAKLVDAGRVALSDGIGNRGVWKGLEGNVFSWIDTDSYGDYSVGRWVWFLEDVVKLDPPIPAKGRQWFWDWDPPQGVR